MENSLMLISLMAVAGTASANSVIMFNQANGNASIIEMNATSPQDVANGVSNYYGRDVACFISKRETVCIIGDL